jgi:hypothetical protein
MNPQQVYDAEELYLVSDSSLHPITSKAAFEWVLSTTDRSAHIKRCASSRPNPRYTSSTFRAQLDGVNNGLQYCDDKGLNSKSITIYCDNLEVIRALGGDIKMTVMDMNFAHALPIISPPRISPDMLKVPYFDQLYSYSRNSPSTPRYVTSMVIKTSRWRMKTSTFPLS